MKRRVVTALSAGLALLQAFSSVSYAWLLFLPFDQSYAPIGYVGSYPGHTGTDYRGAGHGTPVYAAYAGTVVAMRETENDGCDITWDQQWNYGNYVKIDHRVGVEKYRTEYWHLKQYGVEVNVGDNVNVGDLIAYISNSGLTFGADCAKREDLPRGTYYHLHFEVRKLVNGSWVVVDPYNPWLWTSNPPTPATQAVSSYLIGAGEGQPVYFLENGVRRSIPDAETFNALAFDWSRIQTLDPGTVNAIPQGPDLPSVNSGWVAAYYSNPDRSSPPVFVRAEGPGDWGLGSPGPGIPSDNFSARFAGIFDFPVSGPYTFHGGFDDVGIVYFDHQQVINYRCCGPQPVWTMNVSAGRHIVHVDFTEDYGGAAASLWWNPPAQGTSLPFDQPGWTAAYYSNVNWAGSPVFIRPDAPNFDWGLGSPGPGIPADLFSARFIGNLNFSTSGPYTFHGVFDDVGVVYLGGQQIINYRCCSAPQPVVVVNASAGENRLRVDFAEDYGGATARLWWDAPVRPQPSASSPFAPQGSNGWYNTDVPVVASGSSPYGIAQVAWQFEPREDGDWKYISASGNLASLPAITQDGVHSLRYNVQDIYGNWGEERVIGVKIDKTVPSTQITSLKEGERYNSESFLGIFGTAADNLSGVVRVEVRIEREGEVVVPWTSAVGANGWTFADFPFADGAYTVYARATDLAGNLESTARVSFVYDNTSPETTISLQGPSFQSESGKVFVSPETEFALEAEDNLSGVAQTTFSVDEEEAQIYEEEFSLESRDGQHAIGYSSEDNAGNVEPTNSQEVYLDSTAPVSTDNSDGQWHNNEVTVTLAAQDPPAPDGTSGSGVQGVVYGGAQEGEVLGDLAQITFTEEGTHNLTYFAVDNVENVEEEKTAELIKIDKTAPRSIAEVDPEEPDGENGWYRSDVEVSLEATDENPDNPGIETSGVRQTNVAITNEDGVAESKSYNEWDVSLPFEEDGIYAVEFNSEDWAGNVEDPGSTTVQLDKTKPTSEVTSLEQGAFYNAQTWPGLAGLASDNLSGVSQVEVRVDKDGGEGDWEGAEGGEEWVFEGFGFEDGFYTVYSRATDFAGNQEPTFRVGFAYDATPPITSVNLGGSMEQSGWHVSPVTLGLTAEDATAGVAQTFYRFKGPDPALYNSPLEFLDGVYEVEFWSVDRAGNEEKHQFLTFLVDTIAPAAPTASVAGGNFFDGEQVTVSLVGEEGALIYYLVNGEGPTLYVASLLISSKTLFAAYAVDEAGNRSATVSWDFDFKPRPVPQVLGAKVGPADSGLDGGGVASSLIPSVPSSSPPSSQSLLASVLVVLSGLLDFLYLILRKILSWQI